MLPFKQFDAENALFQTVICPTCYFVSGIIQKLIEAVDGDLAGVVTRLRATIDVSKDYQNFSGLSDGMDGQVKFIYRTESIGE